MDVVDTVRFREVTHMATGGRTTSIVEWCIRNSLILFI